MSILARAPKNSWQPVMNADTTIHSYWLNWRFLLCCIWVLTSMVFAAILINKYEGPRIPKIRSSQGQETESPGLLYQDEVWKPCLKTVHPTWLLAFRVFAFLILLLLLILNVTVDGGDIFYYYTQWTFTLITIYFAIGSILSMYGCYKYHNKVGIDGADIEKLDTEYGSQSSIATKHIGENAEAEQPPRQIAEFWEYVFQIIFQMNAGAVTLTDCVFWFILVPYLTIKGYKLNFRFPWFRIGYFFIWTGVYVIFQWAVHACISIWWPYPFLDLSSAVSPLWYLLVAFMHIPCYGVFVLVMKLKHHLLSKWFPQSYQCAR